MDVFALALSYLALRLSALPADDRHTFGYHRLEVLAALVNGVTLGAIAIEIFSEAWRRWQNPAPIKSQEMMIIAVIGLVVNLVVVYVLGGTDTSRIAAGRNESTWSGRRIECSQCLLACAGRCDFFRRCDPGRHCDLVYRLVLGRSLISAVYRRPDRGQFMAGVTPVLHILVEGVPNIYPSKKLNKAFWQPQGCRIFMICTFGASVPVMLRSVRM